MAEFRKLAEEIRTASELLAQRARYQQWLAASMEMLGLLAEELQRIGAAPPELLAASGLLVWRLDSGKVYAWATQSSGASYEARVNPSSAWLSKHSLHSENASNTALWIADRLEELKAEALKGEPL